MGCETQAEMARQRDSEQQKLLDQGHYVRTSALGHNGRVKVLFRNAAGDRRAFWMPSKTYQAIPLLKPATPAHFKVHGEVSAAKNTDLYDPS